LKPKVFVTRRIPPPGPEILSEYCEVETYLGEQPPKKEEILAGIRGKDAILCLLTDKIDRDIMDVAPNLKVISSFSVGYDHIDVAEATRRGIYVTYTPGVLTEATADFAWTLLMAIARRIVEADRNVRTGNWKVGWGPMILLGDSVYGKTLGIVGLGRIGAALAKRAKGFDMKVVYYDIVRAPIEKEKELGVEYVSLEKLLGESDFVSIHVPLSKETYHLFGEAQFKQMKRTAFLINTSRGPVVDEKALAKALQEKVVAGAALDVFEKEPTDPDNLLLRLDNIVMAPHIASATKEARSKMSEVSAKNLVAVLKGEMPLFLVNKDVLKVRPLAQVKTI